MFFATYVAFLLSSVGLTNVLMNGTILNKPRTWIKSQSSFFHDLFSCGMCLGWWTGLLHAIFAALIWIVATITLGGHTFAMVCAAFCIISLPFASSAMSLLYDYVRRTLDELAYHIDKIEQRQAAQYESTT